MLVTDFCTYSEIYKLAVIAQKLWNAHKQSANK